MAANLSNAHLRTATRRVLLSVAVAVSDLEPVAVLRDSVSKSLPVTVGGGSWVALREGSVALVLPLDSVSDAVVVDAGR
jgi:hypothetical protein